ncbi:MAG: Lrp/AsnC family transcriptional regulator [Candidatus Diapherotrites archaeon]|nr:Lrp/AsnC family transcriptional regulator [Candidatus Diapherotrites archaeon]
MSKNIDSYDRKILYALDMNARDSASQIAKKVNLSKEGVIYRINRLLENGYVKNFYTIINAALFGYQYYKVMLTFQKLGLEEEQQIVNYLKLSDNCINVRATEGRYNISFLAVYSSRVELKNFLQEFCTKFGHNLLRKNVHIVTSGYKLTFKEDEAQYKLFYKGERANFVLDENEKKILATLALDARIKIVELARMLNVDVRKVQYIIKKLQENNIIVGYSSSLDLSILPNQLVVLNFRLNNTTKVPSMIEYFDKTNSGLFAYELLGDYDLSVELYVENDAALKQTLLDFRRRFSDYYISYDIAHIYDEYNLAWLPVTLKDMELKPEKKRL